ncbi:type I-F CRISPR-associated protein Csy1 [Desulfamplus magnetovallimortis]|uniref:type I-F CRISPR-associated protein Csy1 n=1 Tax=Desulfamplus magnetovallimortis TaxID=1246637 RepID=UPI001C93CA58|nr:type I-F CRISPR-associated protein Csy1 [Desulfamplus magnetovallimortis]
MAPEELALLETDLLEERQKLEERFDPSEWLSDAAKRAIQRQLVTHGSKYTHPDTKGSSLYSTGGDENPDTMSSGSFVSTSSLMNPDIDSVGNAAALDVSSFLQLSHKGKKLIEYIQQGDSSPLKPFAVDESQLNEWMDAFKMVLSGNQPTSHTLSKQIYFPINDGEYHLISPLYPTSFIQAIYGRISQCRFSETAKEARKAKRERKYHDEIVVDYPNTLVQSFGGTKPQNISQLNSKRKGKSILFSCAPPSWQQQQRPPLNVKSVFISHLFGARVWRDIFQLRKFLESKVDKESTIIIRSKREKMVDGIIDHLFQYGAEIQNLKEYAGWSGDSNCKLNAAQKLWLDPYRSDIDENFKHEREKNDWQAEIANQFAFWFNKQIDKSDKLTLSDAEYIQWQSLVESKFKLFKEDLEDFA